VSQRLCLNMIVKNETAVLPRCLASVRPFIHTWVIVDTGSTDGTQDLIRRELAGLPGELHERPWQDFGTNRTEALELARDKADYILIMDADEVLEVPAGFEMPELSADMYMIPHRHGQSPELSWHLGTLVKAELPWWYRGVLHEVIDCRVEYRSEPLDSLVVWGYFDSARNVDPIAKYRRDAEVLEKALETEPENARYVFYFAQSLKDSNQLERAIEAYEKRVALGGWPEEVHYSLLMIASLGNRLGWEWPRQLDAYLRAYQARPTRAEALCYCAAHYRFTGEWALAELFAGAAASIPRPPDLLFVDESVYAWRALDELAVAAFYTGKRVESRALTLRLLNENRMPEAERARIEANLAYTADLAQP
jgi:glycosyltransferase involved in cell wall biosynthesis